MGFFVGSEVYVERERGVRGASAGFVVGGLVALVASCHPSKEAVVPRPFEGCVEKNPNAVKGGGPFRDPDSTIAGLRPALAACFQEALREDPETQGCVVLSLRVRDGEVCESFVEKVHGLDPSLTECVRRVVVGATFEPASGRLMVPITFLQRP